MKRITLVIALVLVGCGGTAQKRRTFDVEAASQKPTGPDDKGWTVTLTEATTHLGPVRFFEGKVLISQQRWTPYSLIGGTAYAHPGHYEPGAALGEWLGEGTVDLLSAEPVRLGTADAVTGEYGSMQLTLGAPGMRLKGTATKAGQMVTFDTGAFAPPAALEGVKFDQVIDESAGKVRITFELDSILARIDFGAAAEVVTNAFARGVEDTGSYQVTWEKQ